MWKLILVFCGKYLVLHYKKKLIIAVWNVGCVFLPIFVVDTKRICGNNFGEPLIKQLLSEEFTK